MGSINQSVVNQINQFQPSGTRMAFNLTAPTQIKVGNWTTLCRAIIQAPGSTGGAWTFNDANALITGQTITGITVATNAVVTISSSSNPFTVGNTIAFTSVGGMTQINGVAGTVFAVGGSTGAWTLTTSINSSSFSAWTSGGTAASYGAGNQLYTLAYNASANVAGGVIYLEFPCFYGLLLSSVPTAGSPIIAVSYN